MKFGSVCSGIEAASVAWHPLGWRAAWLAEIEPFPSAVLAHHYPEVPNLGDMTRLPDRIASGEIEAPDVFCGGTPCQAFSVAGLRKSLDDARGNLSLTFCEIANAIDTARSIRGEQPCIVFWENVPGVLSTKDNAFGCFLAGLAGEDDPLQPPGGRWANAGVVLGPKRAVAWRVLDAQYFGVAQRRRRVFVVASARAWFDPAAVLFEFDSLRRDTAPSREKGKATADGVTASLTACGGQGGRIDKIPHFEVPEPFAVAYGGNNTAGAIDVATARNACASASGRMDFESETFLVQGVTHSLRGEGFDASEDGTGRGTPLVPVHRDLAPTLTSNHGKQPDSSDTSAGPMLVPVAFDTTQITSAANRSNPKAGDPCHPLAAGVHAPALAYTTKLHNTQSNQAGKVYALGCGSTGGQASAAVACCIDSQLGVGVEFSTTLRREPGGLGYSTNTPAMQVRRLTPTECERLQGFPDGYTAIPWRKKLASECPDGPRYKALGNSWAVPVVAWIGRRIDQHVRMLEAAS